MCSTMSSGEHPNLPELIAHGCRGACCTSLTTFHTLENNAMTASTEYKESDREDLRQGATSPDILFRDMRFDHLKFWLGLGILLANGYILKATHDKITAWPPDKYKPMDTLQIRALGMCGWHEDQEDEAVTEPPYPWVSYHAGG